MPIVQVLLIEDNPADARLLREYLLDAGEDHYRVQQAVRLSEGIECLTAQAADIILLDLGLPDSQGLDTFYRLHSVFPDLPVILLTGLQDDRTAASAVQAGAQDYLNKNEVNQALLERTLRYAIERQRSRLALQASELRLRKIIDQNSIPIFVLDLAGNILFANPAAGAMFGCPVDELLGKEFGYPVTADQKNEITILNRSGAERIAEVESSQTTWEGQPVSLVSLHDITSRKKAEAEQRKARENLSNILESISDGFFSLDENLVVTYYNQAASRLLGRPAAVVLGRSFFEVFPEANGSIFDEKFSLALVNRLPVSFETYFDVSPLKNWYHMRVYPFDDGISVYFQVTTEQKRAEQERQRELDLTAALSELYKPLISPESTLAHIAHEILRRACQLTHSQAGFITSFDPDPSGAARVLIGGTEHLSEEKPQDTFSGALIPRDDQGQYTGLLGLALNRREPLYGSFSMALIEPPNPAVQAIPVREYLAVPVLLGERLVGQVAVANSALEYGQADLTAVQRLAEFYGLAVQRWEVENALRQARDESQRLLRAEHEQRELAETMRDVVSLLVSATDQESVYRRLLEQVARVVPFDEAVIYLVEGETMRAVQWMGYERFHPGVNDQSAVYRISVLPNIQHMLVTGLPIVSADTREDPNWVELSVTRHILSYAGVPIRVQGQVIGFLNVHSTTPGFYNETHLELLSIFADETAIALENARLLEVTRHRLNELEVINKVSASLRAAETLDEMLPVFMDGLLEVTNAHSGAIFLSDPVTSDLFLTVKRGVYESTPATPIHPGEGIVGRVFQSGKLAYSPDFAFDSRGALADATQTLAGVGGLCLPLRTAREIFGVLALAFEQPRQPNTDEAHLIEILADIAGNTFHRMRLHEEIEIRLKYLSALRTIDLAITTSFDLRVTLNVLLDQTLAHLAVDAANILIYNPVLQTLEHVANRGFYTTAIEQTRLQLGQGFAGQAALEGRKVFIPDLRDSSVSPERFRHLAAERFVSYYGVPLMIKGEVKGVLELFQRSLLQPDMEWQDFLDSLARQAAIAIDNAQLFERLQRSSLEVEMAYDNTLESLSRALDLRDRETENHAQRVTEWTVQLARRCGFSEADLVHVRRGALMHDLGKLGVPDSILMKPGPLTAEEWKVMHRHPKLANELLSPIRYLEPALDIPYCHHERWDGSGYPRGLKGEQIPKAARIFAVIDVWDALSHPRVYRPEVWSMEQICKELRDQSGKHFDAEVVEEFIRMMEEQLGQETDTPST